MADQGGRSASQLKFLRWIAAAACVVLLGLGLWVFGRSPPATVAAPKPARVPPDVASRAPSGSNPFQFGARALINAPASSAKAGDVDLCGVGKVSVDANDPMAVPH